MNNSNALSEAVFRTMVSNICNEFDEIMLMENVEINLTMIGMLIRVVRVLWRNKQAANTFILRGIIKKTMVVFSKCFQLPTVQEDDLFPNEIIGDTVILKRGMSPDRIVTKEKFLIMVNDIENNKSDIIGYEPVRDPASTNIQECTLVDKKETRSLLDGILKLLELVSTKSNIPIVTQVKLLLTSSLIFI